MGNDYSWYLRLVLPLICLLGVMTLLALVVIRRLELKRLYRMALTVVLVALTAIGLEIIIDLYAWGQMHLGWSIYAGIPLAVIAIMLAGLEQNKLLKEEVRKRLFM